MFNHFFIDSRHFKSAHNLQNIKVHQDGGRSICSTCKEFRKKEDEQSPWKKLKPTPMRRTHIFKCQEEWEANLQCPFCFKKKILWGQHVQYCMKKEGFISYESEKVIVPKKVLFKCLICCEEFQGKCRKKLFDSDLGRGRNHIFNHLVKGQVPDGKIKKHLNKSLKAYKDYETLKMKLKQNQSFVDPETEEELKMPHYDG